jgi:transposase
MLSLCLGGDSADAFRQARSGACDPDCAIRPGRAVQRPPDLIEILLPENVTLRVDLRVDGQALRRVLLRWRPDDRAAAGGAVYLACGITDMRRGMVGLAMLVQQNLADDPLSGAVYAFRGRRAGLMKLRWHDGIGLCMLKKLERGQFVWPWAGTTGRIASFATQLCRTARRLRMACTAATPDAGTDGVITPDSLAPIRRR